MWRSSPSETNASAIVLAITKDSTRTNSVVHEDSTKLLLSMLALRKILNSSMGETYRFSHVLGKVRDIEVGGLLITLGLEARVEGLLRRY